MTLNERFRKERKSDCGGHFLYSPPIDVASDFVTTNNENYALQSIFYNTALTTKLLIDHKAFSQTDNCHMCNILGR